MSGLGNKAIMAKNIKYYMNLKQVDRNKLCSDLKIKYTTLCDWLNAKTYPRIDKIEMMADYFGIQKADLVEDRDELRKIRLITGVDAVKKELEKEMQECTSKPGIQIIHADGTVKTFDIDSLVYSIMESVSEMPAEQQELVNNMVGGKKKKIHVVENPQNRKKPSARYGSSTMPLYVAEESEPYMVNAAHARTDIDIPEGTDTSDNDIMDDENF